MVGNCSRDMNSERRSWIFTSSGTSAARAPPLGSTTVIFRSGISVFLQRLGIEMRYLAGASNIPTILVMQGVANGTFLDSTMVSERHQIKTVRATMFLH